MSGAGAGTALVAAVGDANDPVTWSGIPFHFLGALREAGFPSQGLPLRTEGAGLRVRRVLWNARRVLGGDRHGGFQYSVEFLERLWAPHRARLARATVFNCFQLYPPSVVASAGVGRWFFVDQTLSQLFGYYGDGENVGARIAREAVAREREGYQAAEGVIVHSEWARRSLVGEYGVEPARAHVVLPGANLPDEAYRAYERRHDGAGDATRDGLRLVFVGKDWRRKGLDRLLRGLALGASRGLRATLRVIGCERASLPAELRELPGVEWCGRVDKRREAARFMELVGESDLGCLLSRAEAGGIAIREYHALGLGVLAPDTGGAPEHALADASVLLGPDAPDGDVADVLLALAASPERLATMKATAWSRRAELGWRRAVEKVAAIAGVGR